MSVSQPSAIQMPLHHRHLDANEESSLLLRAELPLQPTFPTENQPTDNCCRSSWVAYNKVLDNHPLPVKSITAMILLSSGDLVAQTIEHLRGTAVYSGVDMPRVCRFGAFGLFGAPWSHYYFQNLDHYLPASEKPWSSTTATKVSIDQFIQAPILLAIMIVMLDIMKGEDFTEVRADLAKSFRSTLIANWKLWLPASIINLAFVKPNHRVLFVNCVFFVWTIILSIMLNDS